MEDLGVNSETMNSAGVLLTVHNAWMTNQVQIMTWRQDGLQGSSERWMILGKLKNRLVGPSQQISTLPRSVLMTYVFRCAPLLGRISSNNMLSGMQKRMIQYVCAAVFLAADYELKYQPLSPQVVWSSATWALSGACAAF
jgi:hypothetical protein